MPIKPDFKDNVMRFDYGGANVEITRYPGPPAWGWQWEHFISINGDHYPYGRPYQHFGVAVRAAKHRIDKSDFETSEIFRKYGEHWLHEPSVELGPLQGFELWLGGKRIAVGQDRAQAERFAKRYGISLPK
jgi:hypothetical protein